MSLIKSISGFRGTIGGNPSDNLTPVDIVHFASAYGTWLLERHTRPSVVIGRDARVSGPMVQQLVVATLNGLGIDVLDAGLSTTPSIEMAVSRKGLSGGIILTASHNPAEWNALKLLNEKGEFISADEGHALLEKVEKAEYQFAAWDKLGVTEPYSTAIEGHIEDILKLPEVDVDAIRNAGLKVVFDGVASTGGISVPPLLRRLGVEVIELHCDPTGIFPHNPEPLKEHLTELSQNVLEEDAHMGICVDPDVDRLAFMCEDGEMFGEEYTLVAVADHMMNIHGPCTCVSNMSSSRALRDLAHSRGGAYYASPVGEVNVVEEMKDREALIGGEGNGGIILPSLHYGRDALAGIALFLTYYVRKGLSMSEIKSSLPTYVMSKKKIQLHQGIDVETLLKAFMNHHRESEIDTRDGVKVDLEEGWIHLRRSNTEPIIRIYTEAKTEKSAEALADATIAFLNKEME
jgi:phosphomannomutase